MATLTQDNSDDSNTLLKFRTVLECRRLELLFRLRGPTKRRVRAMSVPVMQVIGRQTQ